METASQEISRCDGRLWSFVELHALKVEILPQPIRDGNCSVLLDDRSLVVLPSRLIADIVFASKNKNSKLSRYVNNLEGPLVWVVNIFHTPNGAATSIALNQGHPA